ncbi:GNAT family N-acetyltransferase [Phocaeicola vulgatus]|nr:GNAT family N-acetyltransferase [Phocaeicola vulgatus]MCG0190459.1 GNAT family N-acetyltransferase [Phocaeicola vulgatus]
METTVNSSTYAIPFYQSLGFAVVGEKQNYHGLCSTPMRRYHAVFVQKNKYTLRTWQTEDAHSLVQELNNKMAGGDYNGITKACDEGFYDMYDNKKGSLSANLCALRLGLEPRTL